MHRTLYDILELSQVASPESIHAAYARLSEPLKAEISAGNVDAENQLKAVSDAFKTLSNPQARQRYDQSLALRTTGDVEIDDTPFWTWPKGVVLLLILIVFGSIYVRHERDKQKAETERARIAAEQAEKDRLAHQEAEEARLARLQLDREKQEALQLNAELERDRRRGEQVARDLAYAEAQAERQRHYEEQQREREQQRAEQEATQRARAQANEEKRRLRELEATNSRRTPFSVGR